MSFLLFNSSRQILLPYTSSGGNSGGGGGSPGESFKLFAQTDYLVNNNRSPADFSSFDGASPGDLTFPNITGSSHMFDGAAVTMWRYVTSGFDTDSGMRFPISGSTSDNPAKKVSVRFQYYHTMRPGSGSANYGTAKKFIRLIGYWPGGPVDGSWIGTLITIDQAWADGDRGSDIEHLDTNYQTAGIHPSGTLDPSGQAVWVEYIVDVSQTNHRKVQLYLNGTQSIDTNDTYVSASNFRPNNTGWYIGHVYVMSTQNEPGDNRIEWVGNVSIANDYQGIPSASVVYASQSFDLIATGSLGANAAVGAFQSDGATIQSVVQDATSTGGGRSLRFDWQDNGGADQISRITYYGLPTGTRSIHARMRYKIHSAYNNVDVIKKTFRFRGWKDGTTEWPAGTFNIQYGQWLFGGDNYSQSPYNIYAGTGLDGTGTGIMGDVSAYGPDSFIGTWRTIEAMVGYPGNSIQLAKLWVDGTQILDYRGDLSLAPAGTTISDDPSQFYLKYVFFMDTFNDSVARVEWIDDLELSDSYIGLD